MLEASGIFEKSVKGCYALLARYVAGSFFSVGGGILLARALGPEYWGIASVSIYLWGAIQQILGVGFASYLIQKKQNVTESDLRNALFCQQTVMVLLLALAVFGTGPLSRFYHHWEIIPLVASVAVAGCLVAFAAVPKAMIVRSLDYKLIGYIELGELAAFYGASLLLVFFTHLGVLALVGGHIARGIVSLLMSRRFYRKTPIIGRFNKEDGYPLVRYGGSFSLTQKAGLLESAVPLLLTGYFLASRELGYIQVAFVLLGYPSVLSGIVYRVSLGSFARLQDDSQAFDNAVNTSFKLLRSLFFPVLVLEAALAPGWVPVLYGAKWLPVISILACAMPAYLMMNTMVSVWAALWASGNARLMLTFDLARAGIYWAISLLLIKSMGVLAIPLGLSAAYLISELLRLSVYMKRSGKASMNELGWQLLSSVGLTTGVLMFGKGRLLVQALGAAAYLLIWIYFHAPQFRLAGSLLRTKLAVSR